MLVFLLVILMELVKNMSAASQQRSRKCDKNTKENFMLHKFLYSCNNTENNYDKELKLLRMSEYPNQNNKIILSQQNQQTTKRPLTTNTNFLLNSNNVQGTIQRPKTILGERIVDKLDDLNDDNLKSNVQIVLNNITRNYNALKEYIINEKSNQRVRKMASPESDTNSNPYMQPLGCSIASSQDFTQDYSDYQWFLDYGYRDGITHHSILSALSASYNGIGELSYYEDLAKNLDANLAEVDMESFRTEDIHSLLTTLPSLCNESHHRRNRNNNNKENSEIDNSICKSELLFSPVKESHISVDSLDMDGYPDDDDIILTCQANKNNYTIAFEGSVMYSDDSYYDGPEIYGKLKQNCINNLDNIVKTKALQVSMSRSETGYTTWSKLRKNSNAQRYPNGNNNLVNHISRHAPHCFVRKSLSMPNLKAVQATNHQLNVSQAASNTSADSFGKLRTLLPMYPIPIASDSGSASPAPLHNSSLCNNEQVQNQPSFNLVKLFIKQKSSSTETCMDVSSGCWPSDSTNSGSGGEHNNNNNNNNNAVNNNRCRKKSMNDSGKCSALSRHDEEEFQFDSLDAQINNNENDHDHHNNKITNDFNREIFDSPMHKRNYKAYNLNIPRNHPAKNPVVYNLMINNNDNNLNNSINNNNNNNNNNSFKDTNSETSRTSENLTQIFNNSGNNNTINTKTKIPIEMITKSMQTSFMSTSQTQKEKVRVVPPSFLAQLNKLGDKQKAPVFVIYPNYALPDLAFLKSQNDVVLSPLAYKDTFLRNRKPRPVSMNDIENMKHKEYKHVLDWKSLITLLPQEYRKLLRNIPEAAETTTDGVPQKPLFCMTPPLRRGRGVTCDCVNILNTTTYTSSSSGDSSSKPPSSGYRGSSTMLTDSEMDILGNHNTDNMKNMYVYQYDSPAEVTSAERPPSGRMAPKGILRRTNVAPRTTKTKRNSMFEEQNQHQNFEKRRSLQDPYYMSEDHIIEDSITEMCDIDSTERMITKMNNSPNISMQQQNRLPNVPKQREYHDEFNSKLNKLHLNYMTELNDLELNKAVTHKLNKAQLNNNIDEGNDIDARIRAENFLCNVPKAELKHYAEIANILEANDAGDKDDYDRTKLRNEVSRALSQRKVSFNQSGNGCPTPNKQMVLRPNEIKFSTPPNSPNMSIAAPKVDKKQMSSDKEKQDKIQSNRFKRLQIQWELLSKDSNTLNQDLQKETRSGGNTPTSATMKSRIPRPVSYPTTKTASEQAAKTLRSPSRIVPPKKYTVPTATNNNTPQPAPRTPNKIHTTPKKTVPAPRQTTRTR